MQDDKNDGKIGGSPMTLDCYLRSDVETPLVYRIPEPFITACDHEDKLWFRYK